MNRSEDDRLFEALRTLPPVKADGQRESRIRSRCHARLRRRQHLGNLSRIAALAALFLYLSAALGESLRLVLR